MPAPIESSVWISLWGQERAEQTQHTPNMKEALFDFNVGYIGTAILAVVFLALGALVMFGTGQTYANNGVVFSEQLIELFTQTLGGWSHPVIAIAAFTTMLSTILTCLDAYPRALSECMSLSFTTFKHRTRGLYWVWVIALIMVAVFISSFFLSNMKQLIDLATIMSFLAAPVFAFFNYWLITHDHMPENAKPSKPLLWLSHAGLAFLILFSSLFIVWKLV